MKRQSILTHLKAIEATQRETLDALVGRLDTVSVDRMARAFRSAQAIDSHLRGSADESHRVCWSEVWDLYFATLSMLRSAGPDVQADQLIRGMRCCQHLIKEHTS